MPFALAPDQLEQGVREPINALATLANGGPSEPFLATGIDSDTNYAADIMNSGTGGGLRVRTSGTGALRVTNTGVEADGTLAASGAITGPSLAVNTSVTAGTSISAGTTISATTSISAGTTLTAGTTVQGTQLISTVATGTAPLSVVSTTLVANLNASLLGGFSKAQLDTAYVDAAGDTMTGQLTMEIGGAGNDQAIFLKHNSAAGKVSIGATNAADPSFVVKDNSDDQMLAVNPSGSTYALDVNVGTLATNAARFTGDVLITTDLGVNDISATGSITASGGISAGASSAFTGGVSIVTGGLSVLAGNVEITEDLEAQANASIAGATGDLGFYGAGGVGIQTLVGNTSGTLGQLQTAFQNLVAVLANGNLNLFIDATT